MRFTRRQRENLAKNIFDVGKFILVILVLGQVISEKFNFGIFVTGFLLFVMCFVGATILDRGG